MTPKDRIRLLLPGLLVASLLLVGCHRERPRELNDELRWDSCHVERIYRDSLTTLIWQDTALTPPAYAIRLDLLAPTATGERAALADSLRTYLIRRHALEGPDYTPDLTVTSYLDSVVAYGLRGYMDDLSRAKSLMQQDAESPSTLLSFFTDELVKYDSLTYDRADIVSMRISRYAFNGGANGATSLRSATYDLRHNCPLTVERLFTDGSGETVHRLLLRALTKAFDVETEEKLADEGVYFYEEARMRDNFFLTDEGVTVYFNPYDIAAHFVGPIELTLPYADLEGCLRDEYHKRLTGL